MSCQRIRLVPFRQKAAPGLFQCFVRDERAIRLAFQASSHLSLASTIQFMQMFHEISHANSFYNVSKSTRNKFREVFHTPGVAPE